MRTSDTFTKNEEDPLGASAPGGELTLPAPCYFAPLFLEGATTCRRREPPAGCPTATTPRESLTVLRRPAGHSSGTAPTSETVPAGSD